MDIVRLSKLKTLNIINWPEDYEQNSYPGYNVAKIPQLARVTSDVSTLHRRFDRRKQMFLNDEHSCILEIFSFGMHEKSSFAPSPVYFVQSETSALGKLRKGAAGVQLRSLVARGLNVAIMDYKECNFDEQYRTNDGMVQQQWLDAVAEFGGGGWAN